MLYIGYTNNLKIRIKQHINQNGAFFTKKYNIVDLLYYEVFEEMKLAKAREKQLKNWHSDWKWNLIKKSNPNLNTIDID